MGRHYSGDIQGKFWFGVQSSNDADFFGVTGTEPQELYYYFDKSDLRGVNVAIGNCERELGEYLKLFDSFFSEFEVYNDEQLAKYLNITEDHAKNLLIWYARIELGRKIAKCIEENGQCEFTAEL